MPVSFGILHCTSNQAYSAVLHNINVLDEDAFTMNQLIQPIYFNSKTESSQL